MANSLSVLIKKHLENATHEMHVAFSSLPSAHKWMLFALLEIGEAPRNHRLLSAKSHKEALKNRFEDLCPESEMKRFDIVFRELTEGFLTTKTHIKNEELIDWIHPSCRDLTIDELSNNQRWRQHFLKNCCEPGVQLAASIGGGATGARFMPLLRNDRDWEFFTERCLVLQRLKADITLQLWLISESLSKVSGPDRQASRKRLERIVALTWPYYLEQNAKRSNWQPNDLKIFFQLRKKLSPLAPFPGLIDILNDDIDWVEHHIKDDKPITEAVPALRDFAFDVMLIAHHEESFFHNSEVRDSYLEIMEKVCERGDSEERSSYIRDGFDKDALESEEGAYKDLHDVFWSLSKLPLISSQQKEELRRYARHFEYEATSISDKVEEMDSEERPTNSKRVIEAAPEEVRRISLNSLFEDL